MTVAERENCLNCGKPIERVNWVLGPGWKHENGDALCRDRRATGSRYWEPENQLVLWEASGGVRELHLCDDHHRDLTASLRLAGVGCSGVPTQQPCEVCENHGDWPDLTQRDNAGTSDYQPSAPIAGNAGYRKDGGGHGE